MDEKMQELGRRAIAAGWRWVPGARTTSGQRVVCVRPDEPPIACYEDNGYTVHLAGGQTPDFSDPATLGCLLAQVRERWGFHEAITATIRSGEWSVHPYAMNGLSGSESHPVRIGATGPTEAAALVAALEAAPKVAG